MVRRQSQHCAVIANAMDNQPVFSHAGMDSPD
jgi:hypothetical protein